MDESEVKWVGWGGGGGGGRCWQLSRQKTDTVHHDIAWWVMLIIGQAERSVQCIRA